ncbi:hypothetical protein, partial [Clostridium sp.]|uniref:hypothetical protein n=1 Tax=Clostridium sp. TaxID=1506 RepID=UPI0026210A5F
MTIENIINKKFSISFFNGAIYSRKGNLFCLYFEDLCGKIYLNDSGVLHINCYFRFKNIHHRVTYQNLFKEYYNQISFSDINSKEEFVNLEFIVNGNRWVSNSFLLSNYFIEDEGLEIDVPISKIMYTGYQELNEGAYRAYIPITFGLSIPINKVEYFNNGGFSWNECSFCVNELNVSIKRSKNFYILNLQTNEKEKINELAEIFKEAFNIYQGRIVPYLLETQILNDTNFKVINSQKRTINKPLSVFETVNDRTGLADLKNFIESYISFQQKSHSEMYEWWRKINDVSSNIFEVKALVYSVSIEGTIKNYYNHIVTKDKAFLKVLEENRKVLKTHKKSFNSDIYNYLYNGLGYLKAETASNKLNYLCKQGFIDKKLIDSWRKLRNSLAHGDFTTTTNQPYENMENYQKDLFSC